MPSSISSSERQLPTVPWLTILLVGLIFAGGLAATLEARLAALGYQPTVRDTPARWIEERARAAALGERALILVGASRFQVGLDLDVLRRETGLEPVQLAMNGSAGGPVLESLGRDPAIRGTILFDYYGYGFGHDEGAMRWVRQYEAAGGRVAWFDHPSQVFEGILDGWLRDHLRLYADGADPMMSLRFRILPALPAKQYLVMRPDRSHLADYSQSPMPDTYYRRVTATLGVEVDVSSPSIERELKVHIERLTPADPAPLDQAGAALSRIATAQRTRGGNLILVAMPTSGMVREIEERRYPRALYWKRLLETSGIVGIDTMHAPGFGAYVCPDGSHLDRRDRARFTRELAAALRQHGIGRI